MTGASRGIGVAIAERLAADGRHVVLVARSEDGLRSVAETITQAGGSCDVRPCDLGDDAAVDALIEGVATDHGRLDILVNNAGITRDGLLLRMSDDDYDIVMHLNLRSVFRMCRAAARPMMRSRFGRIVNISSVVGLWGNAGQANYAAAKAGLVGLTKSVGKELGGKGVTANVVAPGFVETDMTAELPADMLAEAVKRLPVRRAGTPAEIAHAVASLTADEASYITGQVLCVDGGWMG
ncbi:MAG: 3-oxoacyl-[acyl-carrier-protein] reductase [Phycisphaerales bacterium]|nr:3-oxoacyl-[acyl-carrier-protein] reductase [Phycisphaerales bacterium]